MLKSNSSDTANGCAYGRDRSVTADIGTGKGVKSANGDVVNFSTVL